MELKNLWYFRCLKDRKELYGLKNINLYEKFRNVPENAKKSIGAGRLKGMTDINPMWRIKTLTEHFGPVGLGWYYEIIKQWIEEGADGVKVAFININLYVKYDGEWSKPIQGTGGNTLVAKETKGLYTSDECYKMALTDALSVACKSLGIGADVYFAKDRTKYSTTSHEDSPREIKTNNKVNAHRQESYAMCSDCKKDISEAENNYSLKNYGKCLCRDCQKKAKKLV